MAGPDRMGQALAAGGDELRNRGVHDISIALLMG